MENIFLSFHFDESRPEYERFIHRVSYYLKKQPDVSTYCFTGSASDEEWKEKVGKEIKKGNKFVLFTGDEFGIIQEYEAQYFESRCGGELGRNAITVRLSKVDVIPEKLWILGRKPLDINRVSTPEGRIEENEAQECARKISETILGNRKWIWDDGLPIGYPFEYEKRIIDEFIDGKGELSTAHRIEQGCPQVWPEITKREAFHSNPIAETVIGKPRREDSRIIVDARSNYHTGESSGTCLNHIRLTFPEAGPRERLRYPIPNIAGNPLNAGILVAGGIAPGINAVISGIVERHFLYQDEFNKENPGKRYQLSIVGYRNGFHGMQQINPEPLTLEMVKKNESEGGSIIGTSRFEELLPDGDREHQKNRLNSLRNIVQALNMGGIDIIYVIGGDGSMRAAHAIGTVAAEMRRKNQIKKEISVVAVPKTMDNDILWIWQSFGFLSAVENAKMFVRQLYTEVTSNPRLCVMQLFGSDSGFVVTHAALASGICDLVLIPEIEFNTKKISKCITDRLIGRGPTKGGLILMAETAIPQDVLDIIDDKEIGLDDNEKNEIRRFLANNRRVVGQTPQDLRSGGLKIVSRVLQRDIRSMGGAWEDFRVFTNEPRHLIRAIAPSVQDVIFGKRLGTLAVDNAMAGYTDFMISQWMTEFVLVPLKMVVLGRKRVPRDGIFWKSVISSTGQPTDL